MEGAKLREVWGALGTYKASTMKAERTCLSGSEISQKNGVSNTYKEKEVESGPVQGRESRGPNWSIDGLTVK